MGVDEIDIEDAARFLASQLGDSPRDSYRGDIELGDVMKFATDNVKAYYIEAASAQRVTIRL